MNSGTPCSPPKNLLAYVLKLTPFGDSLHAKPGLLKTQKQKKSAASAAGGALAGWLLLDMTLARAGAHKLLDWPG
eukprot:1346133-Lingulodinium_polyedra.AAC.1